ncbi:MAG: EAL domain-containing protein, partial [Steroidobacteraceae bacterium]
SSSSDNVSIVQAIVALAHSLRLKVVAEGVETFEQLEILRSLGCDQYQGYHFSPAVSAKQFETLMRSKQADARDAPIDTSQTQSKLFMQHR